MSETPVYIVEQFKVLTQRVSDSLLPYLQGIDPMITGVHYQHGHPVEIAETLMQLEAWEQTRFSRLPAIFLFQDLREEKSDKIGIYSRVSLNVAIVTGTRPDAKAEERYVETFKPILYPIYRELLKAIDESAWFLLAGGEVPHVKFDRMYWGSKYAFQNGEKNQMNDFLDAIEMRNLDLELYHYNCFNPIV